MSKAKIGAIPAFAFWLLGDKNHIIVIGGHEKYISGTR